MPNCQFPSGSAISAFRPHHVVYHILGELRTLVHHRCNVWLSNIFQVVKLFHDAVIVEVLIETVRVLTSS